MGDLRHVVVSHGGTRHLTERTGFVREAELQKLICDSPELLGPLGPELRFLPIGWEVPVGSGRLDLLLLDSAGVVTLIETKLEANDEVRRKVVGQALEYASYAAEWTVSDLESFARTLYDGPNAPDDLRGLSLRTAAAVRFGWQTEEETIREEKIAALIAQTTATLSGGQLRVVCGVDERIESLERIVNYLSAHSDLQIVLLQVNRFVVDRTGVTVLIPTLHGDIRPHGGIKPPSPTRMSVGEIEASFEGTPAEAAVPALLRAAQQAGATLWAGPSGLSVRVKSAVKQEPISVAWVFVPGKQGWMRTRDITFGHGLDNPETPAVLKSILDAYYEDLENHGIPGDASGRGVKARWVSPDGIEEHLEWLKERLVRVITDLKALSPST